MTVDLTHFKEVVNLEEYFLVNEEGIFYSKRNKKITTPYLNPNGYMYICTTFGNKKITKSYSAHRLIAETFIPNFENRPYVNHIDGNKSNNCVSNLEWVTASDNTKHAINTGLLKIDHLLEHNKQIRKLTEEQAKYIRENYKERDKIFGGRAMARKFNVKPSVIYDVLRFKSYK